ncbi:hypothetical protein PoB_007036200 [Plakobranchus ocellatus]|uniref:Uncharacterized protein n=1 Tax=Plakobranchus ocellatus TaxID=259542 RepID=A0AAV4DHW3_9GAST|nr:hypothetical protein PoB_007036200 [Plakobranchus ocellatus]
MRKPLAALRSKVKEGTVAPSRDDLDVKAVMYDQSSNNRAALTKELGISLEQPFISHKFEDTSQKFFEELESLVRQPSVVLKNQDASVLGWLANVYLEP